MSIARTAQAILAFSLAFSIPFSSSEAGGIGDNFAEPGSIQAGVYLRLPFNGGLDRPGHDDRFQYGIRFGFERSYANSLLLIHTRQQIRADFFKLKFGITGFENLAVSGNDVISYGSTELGATESKINWKTLGMGIAVVAFTAIVVLEATGDDDKVEPVSCPEGTAPDPDNPGSCI